MLVRVVILLKNKSSRSQCLVMPEHIEDWFILYEGNIGRVYALRCSLLQAYRILLLDDGYLLWIYLVERIVKVKNILTSVAHLVLLGPHMIHAAHSRFRGIPGCVLQFICLFKTGMLALLALNPRGIYMLKLMEVIL